MIAVVAMAVFLAAVGAVALLRRAGGGDRYPEVPAVGRSEAEERRAYESGLASLEDLGGPGPLAGPSWGAKQLDEETRRRSGS